MYVFYLGKKLNKTNLNDIKHRKLIFPYLVPLKFHIYIANRLQV